MVGTCFTIMGRKQQLLTITQSTTTLSLRRRRACDRCFSVKESCKWSRSDICDRCFRLDHFCGTKRPRGKVGRKPRTEPRWAYFFQDGTARTLPSSSAASSSSSPRFSASNTAIFSIPRNLKPLDFLSGAEKQLIYSVLETTPTPFSPLLGPIFHGPFKQAVLARLDAAPTVLKDAYLASYGSVILNEGLTLPGVTQQLNFARASSALETFRTQKVFNAQDLSLFLSLTVGIGVFSEFATKSSVSAICQHALTLAKPIYESDAHLEEHDLSYLSQIVFKETAGCFFLGQVPTMKFQPRHEDSVDQYLGLFLPLLPYLYDICELNSAMSKAANPRTPSTLEALSRIEQQMEEWQPTPPPDFVDRFSEDERAHILAQASVYSLTILLIIHRLRFPFGVNDNKAIVLSKRILGQLDDTRAVTGRIVPNTSLALMIAAAEVTDEEYRAKILESFKLVPGQSKYLHKRAIMTLRFLWHLRDSRTGLCWSDISKILNPKASY